MKSGHILVSHLVVFTLTTHPATNVIDVFDKCDIVRFVIDVIS